MKIIKSLKLALNILLHSKLRSWLTIVGIVIGVAAVVSIVSIGEGMQQSIQNRLGGLGAELITINPGGGRASGGFRGGFGGGELHGGGGGPNTGRTVVTSVAKNLTNKDIQVLQSIENIAFIGGIVSGKGEVYYLGEKTNGNIKGIDPFVWKEITTSELESGRFLGPSDYNKVVVGSRLATTTFKQPLVINRNLLIEGKTFKIVGILKESGGFGGEDNNILMSIKSARETIEEIGSEKFNSIIIKASNVDFIDQIINDTDKKLMISRHINIQQKKDYSISSAKSTQEQLSGITQTMTLFLGAIAAVSLLVGAVGIANTMFTSVLEKTKEIGVMKAIGAKNKDILFIFMFNSGLVGMVGGLIGISLGVGISSLIPQLGIRLMGPGGQMTTSVSPQLLILALSISVIIGMIAGLIPAYRASRLKPVDALRYE